MKGPAHTPEIFYANIKAENFVITNFESEDFTTKQFLDSLSAQIADPKNFIDKGGAAQVFSLDENFCVKMIENRHRSKFAHLMNLGNEASAEARILAEVNKNIRINTPKFIAFIEGNTEYNGIVMRNANAVNLQKFILGTKKLPILNFDIKKFTDSMYEQTQALQDMGYCHNDLEARNWMMGQDGMPIMIDFGRTYKIEQNNPAKNGEKDWTDLEKIEKILLESKLDIK